MAIVIDTLAETAISSLLGAVTSLMKEKMDLILNAKDELKYLQRKLEHLQKALKDADCKPFFSNERNRDLEGKLKDIVYDAQDIIEEYQTIIDLSKRQRGSVSSWNKVRKPWITLCSCFKEHVSASYQLGNEIKNINQRLDDIEKDSKMVDLLNTTPQESRGEGSIGGKHDNPRETTHHIGTAQPLIGRADDKEKVKALLFDGSMESSVLGKHGVSIVSIVGQGGVGKTTLAKMVFKEVEEQFGKHRWWVYVSEKPNRTCLLQKILKEVCKMSEREVEGITSLSELCTQLQSELSNSKFFLVLDDVWELGWWEGEVENTLRGGAKESKILITSRKVEVSQGIGAKMHKLPEMTFDESWRLFLDVSLKEENELVSRNLKGIGQRIVGKCGGLPLVVRTVGSLMRTKTMTKDDWKSVEKSEIWEWKMPASSSSSEICGRILPGGNEYSHASPTAHTRHLSIFAVDNVEATMRNASAVANKSRTLLSGSLPMVQFTNFKWMRVLSLMKCHIHELPNSIENLSLLKYLDLSFSGVRQLPNSIGKLWNLQTLNLNHSEIEELPNEMGELSNLRYLGLEHTTRLNFIAEGLGKLTNLRTLKRFLVCDDKGDIRGCNIRELKDLNKLKGHLSVEGLDGGRVKVIDAKDAHLKEKHELTGVELDFKVGKNDVVGSASEQKCLLEALEPPHGIESLAICDYKGERPMWYLDTNYVELQTLRLQCCPLWATVIGIKSLEKLEVNTCPTLCELPSMPMLKSLKIRSCDGLNTIGDLPNLDWLQWLEVRYCERLEQVADVRMPDLKRLWLSNLNTLKQLPAHLPSLEDLRAWDLLNWEGWPAAGSKELATETFMPCLREVEFQNCPKMQTQGLIYALSELPGHDGQATRLRALTVLNCPNARLEWKLLQHLPNLNLMLLDGAAMESTLSLPSDQLSTFLPSLKDLTLIDSRVEELKWGRVPEWVWVLSQLEELHLQGFTEDISLGGHWQCLPKLRRLSLKGFLNLKSLVDVNDVTPQQNDAAATLPMDARQQIACLSKLEDLTIYRSCPALHVPQHLKDCLGERLEDRR
ncbi:putative disease resistance RPP13-like protein 1 [Nymphaea colorata]|nr:putative disease resistance RPP13-like protein 1 [Nymphaea colorata]